jgi:DHA1 family inner membrane transport protein
LVTTSYFVVASGRNVPATTMVTAVVKAENRGSFMSVRTSAQQLALGSSSLLAGAIVVEGADGVLVNYEIVGYIAIGMSILAVVLARYLKVVKE